MSLSFDCNSPGSRLEGLDAAERALRNGQCVIVPADHSYAIVSDAFSETGCASIRRAKGAPSRSPLSILIGSWRTMDGLVTNVSATTRELTEAFWPGALSLIVRHATSLSWNIGDTGGTVVVRMPLHPVALELIQRIGPVAASAWSGQSEDEARVANEGLIRLDSGVLPDGLPSTIIDVTEYEPTIRRVGAVSVADISNVLGQHVPVTA